jgi:hypothetical protein
MSLVNIRTSPSFSRKCIPATDAWITDRLNNYMEGSQVNISIECNASAAKRDQKGWNFLSNYKTR